MCGIAGYSLLQQHLDKELPSPDSYIDDDSMRVAMSGALETALDLLHHRGPDSHGLFEDHKGRVGLAHTRLSILDLSSSGNQPMISPTGDFVIVFNGEIYNFRQLRLVLEAEGQVFSSDSDTEVLLRLYIKYRDDTDQLIRFLRELNGIFSFAIWDKKNKSILLARDAFGVKPLYYSTSAYGIQFASEIKALIPLVRAAAQAFKIKNYKDASIFGLNEYGITRPHHDRPTGLDLDLSAIDRYVTYLWCPGVQTAAKGIFKLEPGHAILVKEGLVRENFVWFRIPLRCANQMRRIETKEMRKSDAIKGTDLNLKTAVHRQLLADVPIGALLSGGLDSSSIVAFAREKINELQCFTIQINGSAEIGSSDDLRFAKRVANHLSLPLEVVNVDAKRMAETLPRIIAQLDEPLADPSALNVYLISECARKRGIKVLLSGAGGDDIFSGYRRHQAVGLEPLWGWLPDSLLASIGATAKLLPTHPTFLRRIRKLLIDVSLKGDDKLVNYFRWTRREDIEKLYTEEFRAELNNTKPEQPMLDFLAAQPKMLEPLDRILALEQRFFLTDHNLTYTDRMSMASGVEIRVPFLDLDLVEFASRLPLSYKQRGTCSKWVLKKAMEPYLPRDVIYRKKMGFGLPLRSWLKSELNEWLADTLSFDRLRYRGLFDPVAVQNLISNNRENRIDAAYTLLSLASIEIWCQVYVDNMKSDVGETIS